MSDLFGTEYASGPNTKSHIQPAVGPAYDFNQEREVGGSPLFAADEFNRQTAFAIDQASPEQAQAGVGGVPDPQTAVGQKVGMPRGDFHAMLPDAEAGC